MQTICKDCARTIKLKAYGRCQNCHHKYKRKYNAKFYLSMRYTEIKQRCINPKNSRSKYYLGKKFCTREDFMNKFLNDPVFNELFKAWQDSGFQPKYCPSVDRIDNTKDYLIDNIQILTHNDNCVKDQETKETAVYDKAGNLLGIYESLNKSVRAHKVQQSNAWKVVHGERKTTCGLVFRYTGKKSRV